MIHEQLDELYPKPERTTRYRIIGPEYVNGMATWRIMNLRTGKQSGPRCMSMSEAASRTKDLVVGRRVFWFGGMAFEARWLNTGDDDVLC